MKLTKEGNRQALDAGSRLLSLLTPTDTLQIITSPYTRTRETTAGILTSLASHPNVHLTKVYEEPRLREQDFGNFQPCSDEMERMWQERAAYGHFFYRIPHGESAADAYDRVSGFNESLWRQFAEDDFPSVLVLVTHGLMARVFLMKWYHYSVEYFEDLRNIEHCEFVIMKKNQGTGKYELLNKLRTWSAYKHEQEERKHRKEEGEGKRGKEEGTEAAHEDRKKVAVVMAAKGSYTYGGCVGGCDHGRRNIGIETGDKMAVLKAGRDFGGSCSGAGSRVGSDDESEQESPVSGGLGSGEASSSPADIVESALRQVINAQAEILGDVEQAEDDSADARL